LVALAVDHLARLREPGRDLRATPERERPRALHRRRPLGDGAVTAPTEPEPSRGSRAAGEELEHRPELLAPGVRWEHLVGAVREDDEPDASLGLRERLQHALDALGLLRVDARRQVEHDDAPAARREVARREGVEVA